MLLVFSVFSMAVFSVAVFSVSRTSLKMAQSTMVDTSVAGEDLVSDTFETLYELGLEASWDCLNASCSRVEDAKVSAVPRKTQGFRVFE